MTNASFADFADRLLNPTELRSKIIAAYRRSEPECLLEFLESARLSADQVKSVQQLAFKLAKGLRESGSGSGREGVVQGLIQEFALSSQEGVALMCLAEALLRIPDKATRDALIRDKIGDANWHEHLGKSQSIFVNAATWGLLITGKLVSSHSETHLGSALTRVISKSGEPLIRKGMDMAMRMMGEQFVAGETIDDALKNSERYLRDGFTYSYDMLGEAALSEADALRYFRSYVSAIHVIGKAARNKGIYEGPSISVKLSALHPRYCRAQAKRVFSELYPRLLNLTKLARTYDIGLNIDAEEADRLDLSLDLLEQLCTEPELQGWHGIGFVVQAYQKRSYAVTEYLIDLARRTNRRLMVRLVKGAYWDSEIKRAQVDGLDDYAVFTRKAVTDVSYLGCARKLLSAPDAIFPQFATHNAQTLASIYHMAGSNYFAGQYEFQCLHGMGEPLYRSVVAQCENGGLGRACRIYAPVGSHDTLLAYLVRRLLENGANTSFVNQIADPDISIDTLVKSPLDVVDDLLAVGGVAAVPHPGIGLPPEIYGSARKNSAGIDLSDENTLNELSAFFGRMAQAQWLARPMVADYNGSSHEPLPILNPARHSDQVGSVYEANDKDVAKALENSLAGLIGWKGTSPEDRASALCRTADAVEAQMPLLICMLIREAGKSCANAIAEVREAIDFLRYYAEQVRRELAIDNHCWLGPIVCISPWNFPLAIFTGQISAALAAGNTVLAKPAEQTPLIAAQLVRLMHESGIPSNVIQLLPGRGETVGAALVADPRIRGVMFTGSTEVARLIQRNLAGRLDEHGNTLTLIAETGGLNAMIVDSSALLEQVVVDVIASAFDSAGQRCSSLRIVCVQDDAADRFLELLLGAMGELEVSAPDKLSVDVGPVIDADAQRMIEDHIFAMRTKGNRIHQVATATVPTDGTFVLPTVIELAEIADLKREVFGPVLHMVRYRREDLPALVAKINATGYGLTLGIHSRIDETIEFISSRVHVGNQYVNRNMVGAVVGVQPFGGEGLSGTGPKAGGPLYLHRLLAKGPPLEPPANSRIDATVQTPIGERFEDFMHFLDLDDATRRVSIVCRSLMDTCWTGVSVTLPGPTGEDNTYTCHPRRAVLCLGNEHDLWLQTAVVLSVGSDPIWPDTPEMRATAKRLPATLGGMLHFTADIQGTPLDVVLISDQPNAVSAYSKIIARREGPIVPLVVCNMNAVASLARVRAYLYAERSRSVNTTAAGGNASLLTLA